MTIDDSNVLSTLKDISEELKRAGFIVLDLMDGISTYDMGFDEDDTIPIMRVTVSINPKELSEETQRLVKVIDEYGKKDKRFEEAHIEVVYNPREENAYASIAEGMSSLILNSVPFEL